MKRVYMKQFSAIIIMLLFFPSSGFSETKEIISEGTYNMGDGETPGVAESRALLNAKRVAVEQAGTYVESYSKVKNMQLTEDEVKVLTSGLMEVTILHKKRTVVGDGIHFYVKIKAKVNPDNIEEMAKKVKEKSVIDDYKKIQEAYDKSQKEIGDLKKQLAQAKDEKQKKQVEAKITDDERLFRANEWFDKGYQYQINKEYDKAIEMYTKAIALNPNYAKAYYNLGSFYLLRGNNLWSIKNYDGAIIEYNRAVENFIMSNTIDPDLLYITAKEGNLPAAYRARGLAYKGKSDYYRAIEDFNRAISINPYYSDAYNSRGSVYEIIGNRGEAISDYKKACHLDPQRQQDYGCKNSKRLSGW